MPTARQVLQGLLAVLVSIALTVLPLCYLCSQWQIDGGSIYLVIENLGDTPLRQRRGWLCLSNEAIETLRLNSTEPGYDKQNISRVEFEPEYQRVSIDVSHISPKCSVTINFTDIAVSDKFNLSASPSEPRYVENWLYGTRMYCFTAYYAETSLGRISGISVFTDSVFFEGEATPRTISLYRVFVYRVLCAAFPIASFMSALGILLMVLKLRFSTQYPMATSLVVFLSLYLYIFMGTGDEVQLHPLISHNKGMFSILSIFLHGDYEHLAGNLVTFGLLGVLLESWLKIKSSAKEFLRTYVLFLLSPLLWIVPAYFVRGSYGVGLSLSLEGLSFSLWCYILCNWKTLIVKLRDVLGILLSGLSMVVFYNWLLSSVLFPPSENNLVLRVVHVGYGITSAATAVLLFFIMPRVLRRTFEQPVPKEEPARSTNPCFIEPHT